jgi:hypothetical protein
MFCICLFFVAVSTASAGPDPVALLRGAEIAREPLFGKLRITLTSRNRKVAGRDPLVTKIWIEFDKGKRRFIREEKVFSIRAPKAGESPTPGEQYRAMGRDMDRAIKLGIAKYENVRIRAVCVGSEVMEYSEQSGAAVKDAATGSPEMCFDPRILGVARNPTVTLTLSDTLGFATAKEVRLHDKETIRGVEAWHVEVVRPVEGISYHFWVEDKEGFRIHRYEYRTKREGGGDATTCRAESYYTSNALLPDRVEEVHVDSAGEAEVTFAVDVTGLGTRPDSSVFGYKGLELPPGEEVVDDRIKQSLGFWDGERLLPKRNDAVKKAVALANNQPGTDWITIILVAVAALGAVALIWFYFRRRAQDAAS